MSFQQVIAQYLHAQLKQLGRMERQKRDFFTKKEQAANKFYGDAITKLRRLEPARESTKIFPGDLHAENLDMRGPQLDEFPGDSGSPQQGTPA